MEEGVTIAKVPDWMTLKPEMMPHLIRQHEQIGRVGSLLFRRHCRSATPVTPGDPVQLEHR